MPEEPAKVEEPELEAVPTVELKVRNRVSIARLDEIVHHCTSIG